MADNTLIDMMIAGVKAEIADDIRNGSTFQACIQTPCPDCASLDRRLTKRMFSNGTYHHVMQCCECGRSFGAIKRDDSIDPPLFDEDLSARYWAEIKAERQALSKSIDDDWRDRYEAHMNSPRWREIRAKRLALDRHTCQGCGGRATEVHHLNYKRLGDELLLDLVSLCRHCHKRIHGEAID